MNIDNPLINHTRTWWGKGKSKIWPVLSTVIFYALLLGLSFIFLYPFIYMLVTSFKSYDDLADITVKWFPKQMTPSNWKTAFDTLNVFTVNMDGGEWPVHSTLLNSIGLSAAATAGHLLSGAFIAYGMARYKFPGRKALFILLILTIIVPVQVIIVPQYRMFSNYGMERWYLPMIIPSFLGLGLRGGLFVFLFRQFFLRMPPSLEEAAYIDGCNPFRTFFRIILPSSGSILLVCFVLSMVWHWNDYYEPNIYLREHSDFLLPQMLPAMEELIKDIANMPQVDIDVRRTYTQGVFMAGAAMVTFPLLVMFFALRNRFMQGVERTGLVE